MAALEDFFNFIEAPVIRTTNEGDSQTATLYSLGYTAAMWRYYLELYGCEELMPLFDSMGFFGITTLPPDSYHMPASFEFPGIARSDLAVTYPDSCMRFVSGGDTAQAEVIGALNSVDMTGRITGFNNRVIDPGPDPWECAHIDTGDGVLIPPGPVGDLTNLVVTINPFNTADTDYRGLMEYSIPLKYAIGVNDPEGLKAFLFPECRLPPIVTGGGAGFQFPPPDTQEINWSYPPFKVRIPFQNYAFSVVNTIRRK